MNHPAQGSGIEDLIIQEEHVYDDDNDNDEEQERFRSSPLLRQQNRQGSPSRRRWSAHTRHDRLRRQRQLGKTVRLPGGRASNRNVILSQSNSSTTSSSSSREEGTTLSQESDPNPFASLEALLLEQEKQKEESHVAKAHEKEDAKQDSRLPQECETDTDLALRSTTRQPPDEPRQQYQPQQFHSKSLPRKRRSPTSFPHEENADNGTIKRVLPKPQTRRHAFHEEPLIESSTPASSSQLLNQSRRFAQRHNLGSNNSHPPASIRTANASTRAPRHPTVVAAHPQSIVGSRPKHWGTAPTGNRKGPKQEKEIDKPPAFLVSARKRKHLLAAEVSAGSKHAKHAAAASARATKTKAPVPAVTSPPVTTLSVAPNSLEARSLSFAPSFLAAATASPPLTGNVPAEDSLVVEEDDDEPEAADKETSNARPAWGTSDTNRDSPVEPPSRKRKGATLVGPLVQRLQNLRQTVQSEVLRMHVGHYPATSRDWNNPRRRAISRVDVVFARDPVRAPPGQELTTVLARAVVVPDDHDKNVSQKGRGGGANERSGVDDGTATTESVWTWVMLTPETMRRETPVQGTALRIYNALWIPLSSSSVAANNNRAPEWMLVCTQQCETYNEAAFGPLPTDLLQATELE